MVYNFNHSDNILSTLRSIAEYLIAVNRKA
nr:MAG TPA: hypothetical protein [Siphoviridae sp. cta6m1]